MKKNINKILPVLAITAIIASTSTVVAESQPKNEVNQVTTSVNNKTEANKIYIDGTVLENADTYKESAKLYIPVRTVAESLGFKVEWNNKTKMITLINGPQYVTFTLDVDGYTFAKTTPIKLGTAPKLINGTTYVPVEILTDILDYNVEINENSSVEIETSVPEEDAEVEEIKGIAEITEINEKSITIEDEEKGEIILNINDEILLLDKDDNKIKAEELKEGMKIEVIYGEAMTMSLPPINNPKQIKVIEQNADESDENDKIESLTITGEIIEVLETGNIVVKSSDDTSQYETVALIITEDTKILDSDNKELSESDLKIGLKVNAEFSPVMTRSIPPQTNAFKIIVQK